MSVIYRTTDRIRVKVDNLVVTISPLRYQDKAEIQAKIMAGKPMDAAVHAVKSSLKSIEGVKHSDKSDYELEFDGDYLSDSCVDDLLNLEQGIKINMIALELLNGIPEKFSDHNGNKLDGVDFIEEKSSAKKSKAKSGR